MKPITYTNRLAAICLAATLTLPALAQDAAAPKKDDGAAAAKPDDAAMMAAMMELAKPGENHKLLQGMAGSWTYTVKTWDGPEGSPPSMEATGVMNAKQVMEGRFVVSEHKGTFQFPGADGKMQSMEFNGMAVDGFDNVKKKFVSSWIDNMGTGIMASEGTYDSDTKTLTYHSEYEPMPGMKTKVRQAVTITDANHHTLAFYEDRGGKEVKTMEIAYTRASGTARGTVTRPLPPAEQRPAAKTAGE